MHTKEVENDIPIAQLQITIYKSGAMSVAGSIQDENFALSMVDAARDTIKSHHLRQRGSLLIPASSTGLTVN